MALYDEFEGILGSISYRNRLLSVDSMVNELQTEVTRLKTFVVTSLPDNSIFLLVSKITIRMCLESLKMNGAIARRKVTGRLNAHYCYRNPNKVVSPDNQPLLQPQLLPHRVMMELLLVLNWLYLQIDFKNSLPPNLLLCLLRPNHVFTLATHHVYLYHAWFFDSGASRHMSYDFNSFVSITSTLSESIMTADGNHMTVT